MPFKVTLGKKLGADIYAATAVIKGQKKHGDEVITFMDTLDTMVKLNGKAAKFYLDSQIKVSKLVDQNVEITNLKQPEPAVLNNVVEGEVFEVKEVWLGTKNKN